MKKSNRIFGSFVVLGLLVAASLFYLANAPSTEADTCSYYWQPMFKAKVVDGVQECAAGSQDCTECENAAGDQCAEDGMTFCQPESGTRLEPTMSP